MTCTAGCAGVGVVFVLLVFLYKPDNVEEIETVLAEHHRPKVIDTNEIKNLFKKELPDFDFSLTTTTTSMTSLLTQTDAHSIKHSFRPKTSNEPLKKI